jgi:sugar phosphate isomerase/epimerase
MSTIAMAGTAVKPRSLFVDRRRKEILGIQLYSVREDMQKDAAGTLKQLAAIGYQYVEHANYVNRKFYGYKAAEFKKLLDGLGIKMFSGHVQLSMNDWDTEKKDFTDQWKHTIEDAVTAGQSYLINPWMDEGVRKDYNKLLQLLDLFNRCGELCKRSGIRFGYHNHDFEFNTVHNGKKLYDIILSRTDPAMVAQQLDIGNMYNGGGQALEVLKAHPGRFELMHVKDELKSEHGEMGDNYESTVLGKGILPVRAIVDLGKKSGGTSRFIIEQESYQGKTPVECAKEDYAVMKKWGY